MGRTCLSSLAGAGIGFLVAFAIVPMMLGAQPASETAAITLFVGTFLAGSGAIAGAIIGGVAEFFKRRAQVEEAQRESESEA
jgi:predicted membrane protein